MGRERKLPARRLIGPEVKLAIEQSLPGNAMSATAAQNVIAVVGIDIGKNSFHVVALDDRGAIVLRQKWSRGQVEARFANMPPCLIRMEACVGAHHLSRKLKAFGHDARLMPAKYRTAIFQGAEE
jgi:transposase